MAGDLVREMRAKMTRDLGLAPCEGCGRPADTGIIDQDGCDLCPECAEGCEIEEARHDG